MLLKPTLQISDEEDDATSVDNARCQPDTLAEKAGNIDNDKIVGAAVGFGFLTAAPTNAVLAEEELVQWTPEWLPHWLLDIVSLL